MAEDEVALRQAAAEFGDGGVVVGQLLVDRQRVAELGLRLRQLARVPQQPAEVVVTHARLAAEFGDGGVVVGQLLVDRQPLAVLGLRLRWLASTSTNPRLLWLIRPGGCGIW